MSDLHSHYGKQVSSLEVALANSERELGSVCERLLRVQSAIHGVDPERVSETHVLKSPVSDSILPGSSPRRGISFSFFSSHPPLVRIVFLSDVHVPRCLSVLYHLCLFS